MLITNINNHFE